MSDWQFLDKDKNYVAVDFATAKYEFVIWKYSELRGWTCYTEGGVKMKTALYRATRTALQLVAGGGLTALVTALSNGLAPETTVIVMAANTVVVTYVQNLLEDLGWVKPILK